MCQWGVNRNPWPLARLPNEHTPPKPRGRDHRLSTACWVIERPDHQCGDDLVCLCIYVTVEMFLIKKALTLKTIRNEYKKLTFI